MADNLHNTVRVVPELKCLHCGNTVAKDKRSSREYCSDACYTERKKMLRRNPQQPQCAMCGDVFERRSNRQKFCQTCKPKHKRQYTSEYNKLNLDAVRADRRTAMRALRIKDPEKVRQKDKNWRDKNRVELNAKRRTPEHRKKALHLFQARRANNPSLRVHDRMASAIYQALKETKSGRKWEEIVGYTLEDLVSHLERQFLPGMSWENMGKWHIDHIRPKSTFEYVNEGDQGFLDCWSLTNLRPLWARDNQTKHSKRLHLL